MTAFAYLRVSGAGQVEKDGPERQADAIVEFCATHGLPLSLEHFFEAGVTGTTEDRPQFFRALEKAQFGDCIVVERLDRLARDLMVQEFLLKECRARGVKLFAVDQGAALDMATDGGDPTRKLIRQVLGALAEWEKSALVLKLKKARDRKRAETGRCEGPLFYGRTPQERVVVETARQLRFSGLTYTQLVEAMNQTGFTPRFGGKWTRARLHALLNGRKEGRAMK